MAQDKYSDPNRCDNCGEELVEDAEHYLCCPNCEFEQED
jgi:predicted RNA-binding Zn-ribbon protein involved in translation (DUF1610 family)